MLKPFLMVPVLFLFGAPALFQQATPTPAAPAAGQAQSKVPADYIGKANPVRPTTESQARAKKMYGWDCAMCHGDNGDGKGDVAVEQKLSMRDYRDPNSLKSLSDGEIFYIIQNGKGQMPSEGDRAKPDEIWNLVIYVRKLSGVETAAAVQPPA